MRWRKLGYIYSPQGEAEWCQSHAANPMALPLDDARLRVYFGARDGHSRTSIGWVELELATRRVTACSERPVLQPGPPGAFDDSGCSVGAIVVVDGRWYLYYLGWNLGVTVPWRNAIGLAVSDDEGLSFTRVSPAPVMDRHHHDPFTLSYPWVLHEAGRWRMWYGSHVDWGVDQHASGTDDDHWRRGYLLHYAESQDGIVWQRDGHIAIGFEHPGEGAIARPSVVRDLDMWRMWYCWRGTHYRIGYAESPNGRDWQRHDDRVGIEPSPSGWDSEMIEYPHVFDHAGARYMLYNGNGYGRSGFGLAILEQD